MSVQIESFDFYKSRNRGIPFLQLKIYRKNASVSWFEGTLIDYRIFHKIVEQNNLYNLIKEIWEEDIQSLNCRSKFSGGKTEGILLYIPINLAEKAFNQIKRIYGDALNTMIKNEWTDFSRHKEALLQKELEKGKSLNDRGYA